MPVAERPSARRVRLYEITLVERAMRKWLCLDVGGEACSSRVLLDIGCGDGLRGSRFSVRGWRVTGLDIDGQFLERAKERLGSDGLCVRYDGLRFPFRDASVDVCLCVGVLRPLLEEEKWKPILEEVSRVLKRGGRLVLVERFARKLGRLGVSPGKIAEDLRVTGFDEIRSKAIRKSNGFFDWMVHWGMIPSVAYPRWADLEMVLRSALPNGFHTRMFYCRKPVTVVGRSGPMADDGNLERRMAHG